MEKDWAHKSGSDKQIEQEIASNPPEAEGLGLLSSAFTIWPIDPFSHAIFSFGDHTLGKYYLIKLFTRIKFIRMVEH